MKIKRVESTAEDQNLIVLTRKGRDLKDYIRDNRQLAYAAERMERDKDLAVLNRLDHLVIVCRLDDEDKPLPLRLENARKAAFSLHAVLKQHDLQDVAVVNGHVTPEETIAFAEGLVLTNYQFMKYRTRDKENIYRLERIYLRDDLLSEEDVSQFNNLLGGVIAARDMVNEPVSYLTAEQLSREIVKLGAESGFTVEVFNKKKIESLKMGGLLAVNRGSPDPPTFSILTWKPEEAINRQPVVMVGKGIVYDTGGLSLKPTLDSMDYMKCDMAGAAAVAGAMYAIAGNRLPVWVIGLIPATDNRPDGNAYAPGDVVTMYNGSTVEVLNTDAEGRMILADALSYAGQYDPELVIELSTLTGSAHAAIDKFGIVGMGNVSREVMENLKESGEYCCERIAEFPFWEEYNEQLRSDVADLKNIGGKYAGAITAGKFLEHFTNYPFIHLDIAGPSFNKIPFNYRGKGGSGVGVRILYHFFLNRTQ